MYEINRNINLNRKIKIKIEPIRNDKRKDNKQRVKRRRNKNYVHKMKHICSNSSKKTPALVKSKK